MSCQKSALHLIPSGENQGSAIPEGDNQGEGDSVIVPTEIFLHAQKSYNPSQWRDGLFKIQDEIGAVEWLNIQIPNEIPVTSGNAGNHRVTLFVDFQGSPLECYYKGGADINKPLQSGDSAQIEMGKKYLFDQCTDGSEPGDLVKVERNMLLTINNGDSTQTTAIKMKIFVDSFKRAF